MAAEREGLFITETRRHTKAIWDAYNALKALQIEWNALDYGNTLDAGSGPNAGISGADAGAVVFTTTDELTLRIFGTGHATNLAKLL